MKLFRIILFSLLLTSFFFLVPSFVQATDFGYGSMGGYYTLSEVYDQLDNMYAKYPSLITTKEQIGTTVEGRPIYAVKISDNPNSDEDEPEVFYNALTHAREPMGMEVTIYYMYYLLENYLTDSTAKYLVDNREMWFEPVVNPDGYYYNQTTNPTGGGSWRKNRKNNGDGTYGVDLNRNFGPESYWNHSNNTSSTVTSSNEYRGTTFFSEPETQAMRDFLSSHYIKTALNYHTYYGSELYPYGVDGEIVLSDDNIFREWAIDMAANTNYLIGNLLHISSANARGGAMDYMYDGDIVANHGKIYSFTPEVSLASFWPVQSQIDIDTTEQLPTNKYIAFVAGGYTDFVSSTLNDSYIDPTETIAVNINIKNKGLGVSNQVTATLASTSPYITINNGTKTISSLASQESLTVNSAFDFTVSENAPLGQRLDFTLTISDNGSTINTHSLTYHVATPIIIFSDDCNNMSNWTTSTTQTTVWETTTESYHSSPSSCTDSEGGNYTHLTNALNNAIITKTIDLTSYTSPKLSFWTKYEMHSGGVFGRVQISIDGGSTWTSLTGNYTKTGNLTNSVIGPLYTGFQDVWEKEEIDLTSYAGQQIKIRFFLSSTLQTDGVTNPIYILLARDGWYIDDIKVFQYDETLSDVVSPTKFNSSGGDNIYTEDSLPTFTFSKSSDAVSGIFSYEVLVKPVGKDYYPYITGIKDGSSGTEIDTTERFTKYSGNEISVYSKKETDRLANGAYKWIVRVTDNNHNSIDSDPKILRINTHTANFSGEWFPLVLLTKKITNQIPTFSGISTVGSKVTVQLKQNNITLFFKETTVDATSRFKVNFTDKLPIGNYQVVIFATNKNNDYTEIPEFNLKVFKPVIYTPVPIPGEAVTSKPEAIITPTPTPIKSGQKHCFLWWCW